MTPYYEIYRLACILDNQGDGNDLVDEILELAGDQLTAEQRHDAELEAEEESEE